ncbi:MAG: TIGR01459 family HAD-type hydrolase [Alphaproteobacteria bacterium]|nr:TIGR01459 family HAD-type hydrolase [Alphaproteobacteria bacterium]
MSLPQMLSGFSEIAANYDALIVDIWGVLHNGRAPFAGVDTALKNYRETGGKVLLLSNAPRPGPSALKRLHAIGNSPDSYDDILTSGDAVRALMNEMGAQGQKICHIGPDKDADLMADLAVEFVDEDAADAILFSGMYDDDEETPDDYADMLARFRARALPLLCPNPDRTVMVGDKIIYCAGAVAELYEDMGGTVTWVGKPYPTVYARARAQLSDMTGVDAPRLLAIGDGPKTDILGAEAAGIDALFIAGGLAAASGADVNSPDAIAALLADENTKARYAMRHLVW